MDVFGVRDQLIEDYREFTGSFVDIHDELIKRHVDERMNEEYQWPDPWLSLNPSFAPGGSISDLVAADLLQPKTRDIFRNPRNGKELNLYRHQRKAIEVARTGGSYVLTTGTGSGSGSGSGKSLAYIILIVDKILNARAEGTYQPGIKAIVVYPMNALANSQLGELERFLVLDELRTYSDRQGTDVAFLVRRLRDACDAPGVQCIGTSATVTTEGGPEEQKKQVSEIATTLFGVPVDPDNVIGETLRRITDPAIVAPEKLRERINHPMSPEGFQTIVSESLDTWIEGAFGFEPDSPPGNPRRRQCPPTIPEAAGELAELTHTMETFPIVKRKDIAVHNTYRTKDKIPEIYDAP